MGLTSPIPSLKWSKRKQNPGKSRHLSRAPGWDPITISIRYARLATPRSPFSPFISGTIKWEFVCHFLAVLDQTVYVNRSGYYKDCSTNKNTKSTEQYRWGLGRNTETKATFLRETDEAKSHCSQTTQIFLIPCHDDLLHKQDGWFSPNRNIIPVHKSTPEHLPLLSLVARKPKLATPLPSDSVSAAAARLYCKLLQPPTRAFKF